MRFSFCRLTRNELCCVSLCYVSCFVCLPSCFSRLPGVSHYFGFSIAVGFEEGHILVVHMGDTESQKCLHWRSGLRIPKSDFKKLRKLGLDQAEKIRKVRNNCEINNSMVQGFGLVLESF